MKRDVIARGVFISVRDLAKKIMRYIRRYNRQAKPVKWSYKDTEIVYVLSQIQMLQCTSDPSGNANFRNVATNLGAQVLTTVNYGSGTAKEAAAWVLADNKTNGCDFRYWEIGNECYGAWEYDTHAIQHDPYT